MFASYIITRHARQRTQQRGIPNGIIDLIIDFGRSCDAGDGACRYALAKDSLRAIRRSYGSQFADAASRYRCAYVVMVGNKIITAAFSNQPIFA